MRKDITIAAEPRATRGKNEARRLRARMRIPAVVYGAGRESVAVSVSPKEIEKILHSSSGVNTIFNLDIQGVETTPVMVVDWQLDPVKSNLLHVDLKRIDLTKRLHVKVPVHTVGDPRGVKEQGGLHEIISREIEIECLPEEIPEHFTVDVTHLRIGQSLRAGDIPLSGSMKLLSPPDLVISHVVATRGSVAVEAAEAAAPAEPEVVKKGKKEEEGGEKKK
ncbi:MAG: 50S ribosomal protein L25 [Bryobacteraceae bacterium]|nr:50S ribosomal protein L25 [Bryobacteraceae bacterium]MCX7604882.1 50S ribosomal protein L25 [Bryobacteraceae bacterium]